MRQTRQQQCKLTEWGFKPDFASAAPRRSAKKGSKGGAGKVKKKNRRRKPSP